MLKRRMINLEYNSIIETQDVVLLDDQKDTICSDNEKIEDFIIGGCNVD